MFVLSIVILLLFALAMLHLGRFKYKTLINPLAAYACIHICGFNLISASIASQELCHEQNGIASLAKVNLAAAVVAGAFTCAFVGQQPKAFKLYTSVLALLVPNSNRRLQRRKPEILVLLLILFTVSFFLMATLGGGGLLWLQNPRGAYLSYRSGVGVWYAVAQLLISLSLLVYLLPGKPKSDMKIFLGCCVAAFVAFFTGAKNSILAVIVIGIVYRNFLVRRLPSVVIAAFAVLLVALFVSLLLVHDSYAELHTALSYFQDYSLTTARFFSEIWIRDKLKWGAITLESFLYYIPRALWPDKPYEYGILRVHEMLFPGMASQGHTPGIHLWVPAFWDLGPAGLGLYGFSHGWLARCAFEYFLQNQHNRIAFIAMLQIALWPVFLFVTLPLLMIMAVLISTLDRIMLFSKAYQPAKTT